MDSKDILVGKHNPVWKTTKCYATVDVLCLYFSSLAKKLFSDDMCESSQSNLPLKSKKPKKFSSWQYYCDKASW